MSHQLVVIVLIHDFEMIIKMICQGHTTKQQAKSELSPLKQTIRNQLSQKALIFVIEPQTNIKIKITYELCCSNFGKIITEHINLFYKTGVSSLTNLWSESLPNNQKPFCVFI